MACCVPIRNQNAPTLCCTNGNSCEKTCIETKKVFDASIRQQNVVSELTVDFGGTEAKSVVGVSVSGPAVVSGLSISSLPGSSLSRVTFTITVPLTVNATDQTGNPLQGTAEMTFDEDLVMRVPQEGIVQPTVESTVAFNSIQNSLNGNVVTVNACVTIINKIVAEVILVVPSYGYPVLGPAQDYTQEACGGVFCSPIYPR